jgi:hypothetical protein
LDELPDTCANAAIEKHRQNKPAMKHRFRELCAFEVSEDLSFRSAALSREESAVPLPAASRFLTDSAGLGMTKVEVLSRICLRISKRFIGFESCPPVRRAELKPVHRFPGS